MKNKSRNLLTLILALLCAATVALGVSFALPKNIKINAQASGTANDITITSFTAYYFSNANNSCTSLGDMSTTSPFNDTVNMSSPTSLLYSNVNSVSSTSYKAMCVEFKVGVTVPAWEEWEISYQIDFSSAVWSDGSFRCTSGLYYFCPASNTFDSSNDNSTLINFSDIPLSKDSSPATSNGQYCCKGSYNSVVNYSFNTNIASGYNTSSNTLTLTNNSGQAKQFTFSYAASIVAGYHKVSRIDSLMLNISGQAQKSKELYVTAPKDIELDYTGNDLRNDAAALIDAADWYKRTDANDDYAHTAGEWASYTMPSADVIDVIKNGSVLSGYEVSYTLTDGANHPFKLANGTFTTDPQKFKIKVKPINPPALDNYILVNSAGSQLFAGQQLNTVTIEWDPNANIPAAIKSGTLEWYSQSATLQSGTNNYRYKFTSKSNNYNSVDNLNYSLTVGALAFDDIAVTYTQGNAKIFPSIALTDGTSLPGTLSVVKKDNSGGNMGTVPLTQCTLTVTPGTTLTGGSQGSIRITYTENNKTVFKDITVDISIPKLISITASQKPNTTIRESNTMTQLAQALEVKAYYEDNPNTPKTLAFTDYAVTATLTVSSSCPVSVEVKDSGDNAVSNWQNANSGKCATTVKVEASTLVNITAVWKSGVQPAPVYDRTPLSELKQYLTVTAIYDDGGSKTLSDSEFMVTGNIANAADGGTAVINVEYGGKKVPVQIDNIIKAQLEYVKVTYFDGTQKVYDTDEPDIIRENGFVIVKAKYAQFTDEIIVTSDCTFTGSLVASSTDKSVIRVYYDGQEVDYGAYLDNGGLGVWVEAGKVTLLNKPTAKTVLTYSGEEQTLALANFDGAYMTVTGSLKQTAVGKYKVTVSLKDSANYRWEDRSKDDIVIEWEIKQLVLNPAAEDNAYSGNEFTLKSVLNLTDAQWNFITASGETKKTDVGEYSAVLTIKPEHFGNVVWGAQSVSAAKMQVKIAVADGVSASSDIVVKWKITPAVIAATWDDSKEIPALNLNSASVANVPPDLIIYTFIDKETGKAVPSNKLESGRDYEVTATLNTNDPRANNYVFVAPQPYELNIAAAAPGFAQKVAGFMTQTALGLPVWAWFLIGLAALILLIIIIAVAVKRRKSKEEERQRKEEEKARREEERRLQQERLEAERELARAKQEAELEKIRAQAQLSAGAGMATMATAQPQQPAQQQAIPAQPVQQAVDNTDNELIKEMRQQMAELRADNKATQAQLLAMQNQQAIPAYQQMPMQYPMYQQMPMQMPMSMPNYGGGDNGTLARLESQINAMQAEQRARYDAEQRIELAAFRAESQVDRDSRHSVDLAAMREHYSGGMAGYGHSPAQLPYGGVQQPDMEMMGALVAATLKNMANGNAAVAKPQPVAELPQKTGQSAPVTAKYPPDAVVTTTTTVDTTKNGNTIRRDENFDIDGFYDPLD